MEQIIREVNKSVNNYDKYLQDKEIKQIIYYIVGYADLKDYFYDVFINHHCNDYDDKLAYYSLESKCLVINIGNLNKNFSNFNKINENTHVYYNAYILSVIYHEIEHIKQIKILCDNNINTLEKDLLGESHVGMYKKEMEQLEIINKIRCVPIDILSKKYYDFFKNKLNKFFEEKNMAVLNLYNIDPCERLANYYSFRYVSLIDNPIVSEIYKKNSTKELIQGYNYKEEDNRVICPLHTYLVGTNKKDKWEELSFYDDDYETLVDNASKKYPLSKRLVLGLPINGNEYKRVKSKTIL